MLKAAGAIGWERGEAEEPEWPGLIKYWVGEANKGRSIEEFARFEEKDRVGIDFDYLKMVGCLYQLEQVNSCSTILFAGIRDTMSWQTLSSKRGK